jgi:hypothetical protein
MQRELELVTGGFEDLHIPFGRLRSERPTRRRSA